MGKMKNEQLERLKELSKLTKVPIITATQIAPINKGQIRVRSIRGESKYIFIDYIDLIKED